MKIILVCVILIAINKHYMVTSGMTHAWKVSNASSKHDVEETHKPIIYPEDAGIFPHNFASRALEHGKAIIKHILLLDVNIPDEQEVKFYLYTRSNRKHRQELQPGNKTLLQNSSYNVRKRTVFVIHGWTDSADHDVFSYMVKEFLKTRDINIILVDWRHLSAQLYPIAAESVEKIATIITKFISFLLEMKYLQLNRLHLIGHSLGAQISGIIGHTYKGRIYRITGLDPAGPLFEFWDPNPDVHILDQGDAKFLDIIHTSSDDFGVKQPVGHVDFYPNEGLSPQNGCDSIISMVSCSHVRAVQYMTESINTRVGFWATRCDGWLSFLLKKCDQNDRIVMGYWTPRNARGSFYLKTNPTAPFALG